MVANSLAFTRALVTTNLKAALALRTAFIVQVVFMALNNLTFFVFWWALMEHVETIRGWHLADVQMLFGLVAASFGLTITIAGGVRHLGRFIEDGDLDTLLTRPRSVLVQAVGMRAHPSGVGDLISGLVFMAWSGQMSWRTAPVVLLVIVSSSLIFVACGVVFFSFAFWLGRVETVATQLWELLITFSLYPEPLFGGALRLVLFTVLPAGFVGYMPIRVLHTPSFASLALLVCVAIGYVCLAVWVFERGLGRYASGSRFTTFG
jgi:ABC-2 type transport system permease protein